MENREQEILSEIKSMIASVRSQLERIDAKMVELHQTVDPEGFANESVNLIIDEIGLTSQDFSVGVQELSEQVSLPLDGEPEMVTVQANEEKVVEQEPSADDIVIEEPAVLPEAVLPEAVLPEAVLPEDDLPEDDLPMIFDEPEPMTVAVKAAAMAMPTINDTLSAGQAWRKDMPGTPVRDIRSAISLNDRVIFINQLFNENAQAFVDALTSINAMETLDQVVEYIAATFPQWDFNSDLVYRFMMAVRRKINQ